MEKTLLFVERFLPGESLDGVSICALPRLVAKAEYLRQLEVGVVQEAIGRAFGE
ncbi:MAG: hypothetical protein AAF975_00090 [Spirochaetota bacterium]